MYPSKLRVSRVDRLLSALSASKKNDHAALQCVAELLLELLGEFVVVEALVLGARVLDLQRAHQVADAADGEPVVVLLDAEDQAGAERVAAAGGIGDAALVRGRHVVDLAVGMDHRAMRDRKSTRLNSSH